MANPNCGTLDKPAKKVKARRGIRKASKKIAKMAHCDKVWRACVRLIFGNSCAMCGTTGKLDCHHLISRGVHFFRHNLNNGILLCSRCHKFDSKKSAHAAPWAFEDWMRLVRPEQYYWWVKNRNVVLPSVKIDYAKVYEAISDELRKLEVGE